MRIVHHFVSLDADFYQELCSIAESRQLNLSDLFTEALLRTVEDQRLTADTSYFETTALTEGFGRGNKDEGINFAMTARPMLIDLSDPVPSSIVHLR